MIPGQGLNWSEKHYRPWIFGPVSKPFQTLLYLRVWLGWVKIKYLRQLLAQDWERVYAAGDEKCGRLNHLVQLEGVPCKALWRWAGSWPNNWRKRKVTGAWSIPHVVFATVELDLRAPIEFVGHEVMCGCPVWSCQMYRAGCPENIRTKDNKR